MEVVTVIGAYYALACILIFFGAAAAFVVYIHESQRRARKAPPSEPR